MCVNRIRHIRDNGSGDFFQRSHTGTHRPPHTHLQKGKATPELAEQHFGTAELLNYNDKCFIMQFLKQKANTQSLNWHNKVPKTEQQKKDMNECVKYNRNRCRAQPIRGHFLRDKSVWWPCLLFLFENTVCSASESLL